MAGLGTAIPLDLKIRCIEARASGMTARQVFNEVFLPEHDTMSYVSFQRKLNHWERQQAADRDTLAAGTFPNFTAHGATVQVNGRGEITQAWVKQTLDDGRFDKLMEAVRESATPPQIEPMPVQGVGMLEIPLFDLHFPLSDYTQMCAELLSLIVSKTWAQIVFVVGQDLLHNDDFRGRTSSGRPIEKVDLAEAWRMARDFYYTLIAAALRQATTVRLIYSVGNHDESMAWAFVQLLKDHFPQLVTDDSLKQRKIISWQGCFIGLTHGANAKSANNDLRGQFTVEYPTEFAEATVREIHAGHIHHEREADLYGVMIRRLARGGVTDTWSENEGFVGAHKRFMVFEWLPRRLKAIHYF